MEDFKDRTDEGANRFSEPQKSRKKNLLTAVACVALILIGIGVVSLWPRLTYFDNKQRNPGTLDPGDEEVMYNSDDIIVCSRETTHNSDGRTVRNTEYEPDGSVMLKQKCEYDSDNRLLTVIDYDADGFLDLQWYYEFDSYGNVIMELIYNSDGYLHWKAELEFNEHGKELKAAYYHSGGEVCFYHEYSYHSDGVTLKQVVDRFYSYGEMLSESIKNYDQDGDPVYP